MSIEKTLGKIESVNIGLGGYQDAMMGISFNLSHGGAWGVADFWGTWGLEIDSKGAKWTEADRDAKFAETMRKINRLLIDAKVDNVNQLKGKPIEVTCDGMSMVSWRILTEVL